MVLHHKAHQRQLRDPQLERERLLPAWVEAYRSASRGVIAQGMGNSGSRLR